MMQQLGTTDLREALDVLGAIAEGIDCEGRNLSDRDRECLEAIRAHLGTLYRLARIAERPRVPEHLTAREREVLQWLSGGKTNRDIGCILGISPRTVQKHLEKMYEKLGVETRTAAVTRAFGISG